MAVVLVVFSTAFVSVAGTARDLEVSSGVTVVAATGGVLVGVSVDLLDTPLNIPRDLDSFLASRDPNLSSTLSCANARNRKSSCVRCIYVSLRRKRMYSCG